MRVTSGPFLDGSEAPRTLVGLGAGRDTVDLGDAGRADGEPNAAGTQENSGRTAGRYGATTLYSDTSCDSAAATVGARRLKVGGTRVWHRFLAHSEALTELRRRQQVQRPRVRLDDVDEMTFDELLLAEQKAPAGVEGDGVALHLHADPLRQQLALV